MGLRSGGCVEDHNPISGEGLNTVNYSKLDARLSAVLASESEKIVYPVFILLAAIPGEHELQVLEPLGIEVANLSGELIGAALNAVAIDELSGMTWVRYIELGADTQPLAYPR